MAPWPNDVVEMTLQLDYWEDELSPAQKAAYEKAEKEHNEIRNKLKEIVQETGGKNIFSGEVFTAYQVLGPVPGIEKISQPITSLTRKKPPTQPPPLVMTSTSRVMSASPAVEASTSGRRRGRRTDDDVEPVLDLVVSDDDEDYVPLSKRKQREKDKAAASPVVTRKPATPEAKTKLPAAAIGTTAVRPTEASAIGGLQVGVVDKEKKRVVPEPSAVVDLTDDDGSKPAADSREISFSKIQAKTFPSLVVIARPSLRVTDKVPNDRSQLDLKVKHVLVFQATKFTEWLIQQGLIKSDQFCKIHTDQPLKLGMYSDLNKFPYSGGYFWISDCCPQRFTSVFSGSLFEGSPHPPSVILKLIYHWACQTNVSNVVNWVKVDNVYLKTLYTLLRSVCTLALCRHLKPLGGPGKSVEIGVISLGTTTQDGQQRQVKVEVLGVLDQSTKLLRLRAVEPLTDGDKSYKKRFAKILEPLDEWVHKDSIILTDLTVDKGTLNSMGYKTVQQVPPAEANGKNSNANIMDYLRRIVPRMFQNTLSLLSRQIIQQFLNELVWREMYGTSPLATFDNIVKHLSEQAKIETVDNLITRLNKVSADPFKQWDIIPDIPKTPAKRGRKPKDYSATPSTPSATPEVAAPKVSPVSASPTDAPKKSFLKKAQREAQNSTPSTPPPTVQATTQKKTPGRKRQKEQTVTLENYYYGSTGGQQLKESARACTEFEVWCPECPELTFHSNVELLDHLLGHVRAPPADGNGRSLLQCRCCLAYLTDKADLKKHQEIYHPKETKNPFVKTCVCLICEQSLSTVPVLVGHLQKNHYRQEMPYRCAGCDFRSSTLSTTVDHFYKQHKKSALLQCPFCLKMACAFRSETLGDSVSEPLVNNVRMFLQHMRQHVVFGRSKKCSKCVLTFTSKGAAKFHNIFSHGPASEPADKIKPIASVGTEIAKPQARVAAAKESSIYRIIKPFNKLVLNMGSGNICLECENDFDEFNHMLGMTRCLKCPYQSACLPSVINHAVNCNPRVSSHPVAKLGQEMHCNCGFSSFDGYALARHLSVCGKGEGVYPSVEAAQANVVKRSMLDMLGLIRRDEDEQIADGKNSETVPTSSSPSQEPPEPSLEIQALDEDEPMSQDTTLHEALDETMEDNDEEMSERGGPALLALLTIRHNRCTILRLSLDDLGPPSVLPAQDSDRTPQLKDDYQSLATPRVPDQPDY
ncbi:AGAP001141-PB-like protein [Anopheles sinensis]|uniref:AGAP001141-PB-like protein n=1 Tax=Anopheles sinensis TaxID=74873 RepID=A0A084W0K1_ANOSI|nr:AGAP001141-PB-like protein [Anopheles sinensis]